MRVEIELWGKQKRKVLVAREKGKLKSWKPIKEESPKELELTIRRYKRTNSFNPAVKEVKQFTNVKQTISKSVVKRQNQTQTGLNVTITIDGKSKTFTGYSQKGKIGVNGEREAYGMAIKKATASAFIDYTDILDKRAKLRFKRFYIAWT